MDILVLGTSNAILKGGYVDGLRAALPSARIENRSIGASPGLQFARFLDQDLSRYDAILFDSLVNDQNYISNIGELTYYRDLMRKIASSLSAQTRLIMVEMVNRRFFRQRSAVCDAYRSISDSLDLESLDFRAFAAASLPPSLSMEELFADENHVRPIYAHRFGTFIAQAIATPKASVRNRSHAKEFAMLRPAGQLHVKSNTLYSFSAARLQIGDAITLESGLRLVGLLIDAEATRCALRLEGETDRYINLRYNLSDRLQIKFVPIRNGHACHRITVIAAREGYEPSRHEIASVNAPDSPILSVSNVVCTRLP